MSVLRLIWMEIVHRKLTFLLALVAVAVAVAYSVSSVTVVRGQQLTTEANVAKLNDDIRKIQLKGGFNIDIMPKDVNLANLYANDFGEATMPYDLVNKLAESRTITKINHLRPALIRKVEWTEHKRDNVILMGVAAVVPWAHRKNPNKPLAQPVPAGKIVVGSALAKELNLEEGKEILFRGEKFSVAKVQKPQHNVDDITVWIDLAKMQKMLNLPNQINRIQALDCNCASEDRLGEVRAEISQVLGGEVQVHEWATKALMRAESRDAVEKEGAASLKKMEHTATIQTVLLAVGACAMIGLLMFINARERRHEVGILRAIGTSTWQIILLFVGKALLVGVLGALVGYAAGFAMGLQSVGTIATETPIPLGANELFNPEVFAIVVAAATLLAVLASWIPAVIAASQDPAVILSDE